MLNIGTIALLRAVQAGGFLAAGAKPPAAAAGKGGINAPARSPLYTEDPALEIYELLRATAAELRRLPPAFNALLAESRPAAVALWPQLGACVENPALPAWSAVSTPAPVPGARTRIPYCPRNNEVRY